VNGFRRHGPGLAPPYDGHSASGPCSTIRRVLQRVRWLPSSPVSRNDGTSELLSRPRQLSTIRAIAMACADFGDAIMLSFSQPASAISKGFFGRPVCKLT
jgi:hypothetical protein